MLNWTFDDLQSTGTAGVGQIEGGFDADDTLKNTARIQFGAERSEASTHLKKRVGLNFIPSADLKQPIHAWNKNMRSTCGLRSRKNVLIPVRIVGRFAVKPIKYRWRRAWVDIQRAAMCTPYITHAILDKAWLRIALTTGRTIYLDKLANAREHPPQVGQCGDLLP